MNKKLIIGIAVALVAVIAVVSIIAISSKKIDTGLTLETFKTEMGKNEEYFILKEENGVYKYSYDDVSYEVKYVTNKGSDVIYLTNIVIISKDIPESRVNSPSEIKNTLSKSYMQWTSIDYKVIMLFNRYSSLLKLINKDFSKLIVNDIVEDISYEAVKTYGNWEISIDINEENVVIEASYINK